LRSKWASARPPNETRPACRKPRRVMFGNGIMFIRLKPQDERSESWGSHPHQPLRSWWGFQVSMIKQKLIRIQQRPQQILDRQAAIGRLLEQRRPVAQLFLTGQSRERPQEDVLHHRAGRLA